MTEQRRNERKEPIQRVVVFNSLTREQLGQLGNITPEGLMLITDEPILEGSIFQLSFTLIDPAESAERNFDVGATSLWSAPAASGNHWSGFQIIDISDPQQESLSSLYSLM